MHPEVVCDPPVNREKKKIQTKYKLTNSEEP